MVSSTRDTADLQADLARLRLEKAELRTALETRTQENSLLLQMIGDVISTVQLDQVLQYIVEHLTAAVGCHAAFVYLWEPDRRRLVLRGATQRFGHMIGRIELNSGEGLVGWSAQTGKPVMLRERALEDPRFRYFPELEEERFQAMMTVPMTSADGQVVAVISMHTIAPQEFTDEHVRMVGAVAPILGGAIVTSKLYESTTRKLGVLSRLSGLVQTVHSARSLDDALRALAATTVEVTASDLCVLVLDQPGLAHLAVRAYTRGNTDDTGAVSSTMLERQPWEILAAIASPAQFGLPDVASGDEARCGGSRGPHRCPTDRNRRNAGVNGLFQRKDRPVHGGRR